MFRRILPIALMLLPFLYGCGKDSVPAASRVVKTVECTRGGTFIYKMGYLYDSEGRVTELNDDSMDYGRSSTFFYAEESITILGNDDACIINLDVNGVPQKIVSENGIIMCSYGADGYVNRFDVNSGTSVTGLPAESSDGNFISLKDYDGTSISLEYTMYPNDYSIDLNGIPDIGNMFSILNTLKIKGMYSRNLVKSMTAGEVTWYFTYNFDADGRVTDMVVVSTASEDSLTEHYKLTY